MKINFRSVKQITTTLCMATLLVSCDGSNKEVPEPPPAVPVGKVSGVVMLGPVDNATLTLYKLDPVTGEEIEPEFKLIPNATGRSGKFNFTLQENAAETPFALCATDGTYSEPAALAESSRAIKEFSQGERLCAAFVYKKADAAVKKETIVNITFFTHLAYGIMKYEMSLGGDAVLTDKKIPADTKAGTAESIKFGAIGKGNDNVRQWFNFNDPLLSITPRLVNDSRNRETNGSPTEGLKYGLALTGISSTADWLVVEQSIIAKEATTVAEGSFENVSSISFAQEVFDDMVVDGELNGYGTNGDVQLNGTRLDAHIFLHHFPARMLAVSGSTTNKSEVVRGFSPFIAQIAEFRDSIFDPAASTELLSSKKPNILHPAGFDTATLLKGQKTFKVNVLDLSGIKSALLTITKDGTTTPVGIFNKLPPTAEPDVDDPSLKVWDIDTKALADGLYTFTVDVVNNDGISNFEKTPNIKIGNNGINVQITAPSKTATSNVFKAGSQTFTANVTDPFPGTIVAFEVVAAGVTDDKSAVEKTMPVPKVIPGPVGVAGAVYSTSYNFAGLVDNDYKFRVKANSGSGAGELAQTAFDLVAFSLDTTLPAGNITTPGQGSFVKTQTFQVSASVRDSPPTGGKASGVKNVIATVAGIPYDLSISNGIATGTVDVKTEGFHNISLEIFDNASNKFQPITPVKVGYDKSPPVVNIANGKSLSNTWVKSISFDGTATDNPGTGVVKVGVKMDVGGTIEPLNSNVDGIASLSFTKSNFSVKDGQYNVIFVAEDASGKLSVDVSSTITKVGFDNTKPTISAIVTKTGVVDVTDAPPTNSTQYVGTPVTFTVEMLATESGFPSSQSGLASMTDSIGQSHTNIANRGANTATHPHEFTAAELTMNNVDVSVDYTLNNTYDVAAECIFSPLSDPIHRVKLPNSPKRTAGIVTTQGNVDVRTKTKAVGIYTHTNTGITKDRGCHLRTNRGAAIQVGVPVVTIEGLITVTTTKYTTLDTYRRNVFTYSWLNEIREVEITRDAYISTAGTSNKSIPKTLGLTATDNVGNTETKVQCLNAAISNAANKFTSGGVYSTGNYVAGNIQFDYLGAGPGVSFPATIRQGTSPTNVNLNCKPPLDSSNTSVKCTKKGTAITKSVIDSGAPGVVTSGSGIKNLYSIAYTNPAIKATGASCP